MYNLFFKKYIQFIFLSIILFPWLGITASWYSSPTGTIDGNGSVSSPWPLHIALQSTSIQPGDTLYLRGGTYRGPGFECNLSGHSTNYITVTSYPNEWAIISDGMVLTLGTNLPTAVNNDKFYEVPVFGSEPLAPDGGYWFRIGNEVSYAHNKVGSNKWELIRNYNITNHTEGDAVFLESGFLKNTGNYIQYMNFEITSMILTNRDIDTSSGRSGKDGLNFVASGKGNKAINLIIHNVGHPGIGFWNQQDGGEINGCILWGNGYYDTSISYGGAPRGNGVYTQNDATSVVLKNNIVFRNLTHGIKAFGEGGSANGFYIYSNIVFGLTGSSSGIHVGTGGETMTNNFVTNNIVMGNIHVGYTCLSNKTQIISGNICLNTYVDMKDILTGAYTNNINFLKYAPSHTGIVRFTSVYTPKDALNIEWDNNEYYLETNTGEQNFGLNFQGLTIRASNGGGNLFFQNDETNSWKDWSGFDEHSTYQVGWPSTYTNITIMPLDYNPNRYYISVINMTSNNTASIDMSSYGWIPGQLYSIIDAQNWPDVIQRGIYNGTPINIPLTLTNVSNIPGITHYTNKHTNVDNVKLFNVFILTRERNNISNFKIKTLTFQ